MTITKKELSEMVATMDRLRTEYHRLKKIVDDRAEKDMQMVAFYRCPTCFGTWDRKDQLALDVECDNCGTEGISPYFCTGSTEACTPEGQQCRLTSLARHEKDFVNPDDEQTYHVDVRRSASQCAQIEVRACGPATAMLIAEEEASNYAFEGDYDAEYSSEAAYRV